jgi:putative transposase
MGAFFQNRYKSIVCQEDAYLLELVRYIHLNLLRAGLVKTIDDLNLSPFSGHSALAGYVARDWQDTPYVLSFLDPLLRHRETIGNVLNKELLSENDPSLWAAALSGVWAGGLRCWL